MERNKFLELHADLLEILRESGVPFEVRAQVSERLGEYKTYINKQVSQLVLEAQKML